MKRLLFVIGSLNIGGAEKALISLLHGLDYDNYEVDLLLFDKTGPLISQLPQEVKLISLSRPEQDYRAGGVISFARLMFLNPKVALTKIRQKIFFLKKGNPVHKVQLAWENSRKVYRKISKHYDVAVGYVQTSPIYFIVDKVEANFKIGYMHTNYLKKGYSASYDKKYFEKLDVIATVSNESLLALNKTFPDFSSKILLDENNVSVSYVRKLSEDEVKESNIHSEFIFVTVARLHETKGIILAIDAGEQLALEGFNYKWIIVGEGPERKFLEDSITEKNLNDYFYLVGEKENPYPYIKLADIYVQTSLFEGYCIAVDEAIALDKVVISTDSVNFDDRIQNNVTGIICQCNSASLFLAIKGLINDKNKLLQMKEKVERRDYFSKKKNSVLPRVLNSMNTQK